MTPRLAIKKKCTDCQPEYSQRNKEFCEGCVLSNIKRSSLKPIRAYCLWCMNGQAHEVRLCNSNECILFDYRFGHNPKLKGRRGNTSALIAYRMNKNSRDIDKYN